MSGNSQRLVARFNLVLRRGENHVEWFEGSYRDYEADRHRRLGTDADKPHRIKCKLLVQVSG